jgi:hypothetical protein
MPHHLKDKGSVPGAFENNVSLLTSLFH